jgi:DNA-3-methyladenine glycosylase II
MFAIFTLQRPDILPVGTYSRCIIGSSQSKLDVAGDLGIQRGLLRWTLSLHLPEYRIELSPKKHPDPTDKPKSNLKPKSTKSRKNAKAKGGVSTSNETINSDQEVETEADELPSLNGLPDATEASPTRRLDQAPMPPPQDVTSVLPSVSATTSDVLGTPLRRDKDRNVAAALTGTSGAFGLPSMPSPLTPSVTRVLAPAPDAPPPPPLPMGLTIASLKSRSDGKKKIKCVTKTSSVIPSSGIG